MIENMFTMPDGWEKVVYCKDCKNSYATIAVPAGRDTPIEKVRFCGKTNRLVKDKGYCDEGNEGV